MRIPWDKIKELRDTRYRRRREVALRTEAEAEHFIQQVGFCFLFPVQGVELPSLWEAINGGQREIPRHHHDYALHLAWSWKDSLPTQRRVFYAKLLKAKPTLVSLDLLPCFYALSENYGEMQDYLEAYEAGRMSEEAKRIYEILLSHGPCNTGILRREAGLAHNSARFDRAILELQRSLRIAKCGISDANRWKYCYVYEILPRWLPEQVEAGVQMRSGEAMQALIARYLETVVLSTPGQIIHLFEWSPERTQRILRRMLASGTLQEVELDDGEKGVMPAELTFF